MTLATVRTATWFTNARQSASGWTTPLLGFAGLIASIVLVASAYVWGAHRSNTHLTSGSAYSTETQITITTDGWAYRVSLDVPWTDRDGVEHQGTRPECLPPVNKTVRAKFAWVPVNLNGVVSRTVVWVDCHSS